jgi:hypothetical protein
VNGNAVVELIQANLTTNTQTVVASHTLTAGELAGNTQIEFQPVARVTRDRCRA